MLANNSIRTSLKTGAPEDLYRLTQQGRHNCTSRFELRGIDESLTGTASPPSGALG